MTAQRREQRLQDVPLAVTALSEDALRSRNINSVGDLGGGKVPGLMVGTIFASESSISLNFRGLAANDPSQGTMDSPAAFYIDGINMPRGQGLALELITPERNPKFCAGHKVSFSGAMRKAAPSRSSASARVVNGAAN